MKFLIHIKHPVRWAIAIFIFLLLCGTAFFEYHYRDRFFPGVVIGGESLRGIRYQDVIERVTRVGEGLALDGIHVVIKSRSGDKTIIIPERSTGLTPDVVVEYFSVGDSEKVVDEAFALGHTGSFWSKLLAQYRLLRSGYSSEYDLTLREESISSILEREQQEQLAQPQDAHLVRGTGGFKIEPEKSGEQIDTQEVLRALKQSLRRMQTNQLQVAVRENAAQVTVKKIEPILGFAGALSTMSPITLTYTNGRIVYLSGSRLAGWLTVDPNQPGVVIKVSEKPLKEFVQQYIDGDLADAPRNSRFAMVGGKLVETSPAQIGTVVAVRALAAELNTLLNKLYVSSVFGAAEHAQSVTIPVSYQQEYPLVTSSTIARFKIADLLGNATTSFRGSSAERIKNIRTGVERASGILIAPGKEFSLVDAIGEVTEETGFEKEYVIKGDRSIKEVGGGLCQLATTVFRGAIATGLPITERQNHSYVVGYYGPGLDATIYGPHPDLKFINDTGNYLLFQMKMQDTQLISEFYGVRDGRVANTTAPVLSDYIDPPPTKYLADLEQTWGHIECHDQPRKGLTAVATTTVTYADGRERTQVFNSVYTPWPKICLVGIKAGQ